MPELRFENPATRVPHEPVAWATEEAVTRAVAKARAAFGAWKRLGVVQRAHFLSRAADVLDNNAVEIGHIITSEMGRVLAESIPEVRKSAAFLRYFANVGPDAMRERTIQLDGTGVEGKAASWIPEPRGVAAIIKPWNAPIQQIVWAVGPALISGCCAIVKPSEYTPRSALWLQIAFEEAGIPAGVYSTLLGGAEVGTSLINSEIDVISFTGSNRTGINISSVAGSRLKKCILELSGKDGLIVDKNFNNLELLSNAIVYGAFSNCGQWCSSIEHVYIHSTMYDSIVPMIVEKTRSLRIAAEGVGDIGPIANIRQYEIVSGLVQDATNKGAVILTGGIGLKGAPNHSLFYSPTILSDVPADAEVHRANIFGPVVVLHRYESVEDAFRRLNDTPYGLGASVWTEDDAFRDQSVANIDAGMVWVNEPLQSIAACPWSVTKASGLGVELGEAGIMEFTYQKVIQAQIGSNEDIRRPWYFPYPDQS